MPDSNATINSHFSHCPQLSISYNEGGGLGQPLGTADQVRMDAELVCLRLAGNDNTRIDAGHMGLRMADIANIRHKGRRVTLRHHRLP